MTTVTLTRETAQQVLDALKNSNRVVWHYAYSKSTTSIALSCDEALTIMQAAIEAKSEIKDFPSLQLGTALSCADVKKLSDWMAEVHTFYKAAPQAPEQESHRVAFSAGFVEGEKVALAPARELTQPDLQRMWNDAMYANRQSTTDAAMDFGFAVQAALREPEQKLEPLAGGWGVD